MSVPSKRGTPPALEKDLCLFRALIPEGLGRALNIYAMSAHDANANAECAIVCAKVFD